MKPDHPPLHSTICTALSKLGHQHLLVMSQPPSISIIQLVSTSTACLYINRLDHPLPLDKDLRVCISMTIIPNLVQHLPPITHRHLHSILGNTIMTRIANPLPHNIHIQLYMMANPCLIHFTIINSHMGSTAMNNMTRSSHHNLPNHPLMLVIFARHQIHGQVLRTLRKRPP